MKERRWAIIASDGRHVWLGRHTDPSSQELERAAEDLARARVPGWLAVTEGVFYSDDDLVVMMVRPLWGEGDWDSASAAFLRKREAALKGV